MIEDDGDLSYRHVKAELVAEFTQEVYDRNKSSIRLALEHIAKKHNSAVQELSKTRKKTPSENEISTTIATTATTNMER